MKTKCKNYIRACASVGSVLALAGTLALPRVFAQTIPNPSFETDTFALYPGYVSDNTAITGWTVDNPTRAGINPAGGANYFADNGPVPDGTKVAFLQSGATLSTTISGLTAGQSYLVTFRANSQIPAVAGDVPNVHVVAAGQDVWALTYTNLNNTAEGLNPYGYLGFQFTATGASDTVSILNDSIYETALLLDDFRIAPSDRWTVAAWNSDEDSGIDASYIYTHAYSFGSTASPVINAIQFSGVAGINPSVSEKFSTANFGNDYTAADVNNITGSSSVLADQFIYQGGDIGTNLQTITVTGLTSGKEYILTLYSVGWETPGLNSRWATIGIAGDYLTINQDAFGDNNGIRISYRYTADASGTVTIRIAPVILLNTSMHIYGFSNRETVVSNQRPGITLQPVSATVAEGVEVAFKVAATGFPVPTYQWRLDGANIQNATTDTYTVTASQGVAGNYDVVVQNFLGSATSQVARLTVGLPMANPSFEADSFLVWPGYISGNTPITAWTSSAGNHGINPVQGNPPNGPNPFADNGQVPQGSQVAFMQGDGTLSQIVSGFTVGANYYLHYYENGRSGVAGALEVKLGGTTLVPVHLVAAVGAGNPYREVLSPMFTASATELELSFVKSNPQNGDSTVLIDNVAIIPVAAGTPPSIWTQPQAVTAYVGDPASFSVLAHGSLPLSYQWRRNGNAIVDATNTSLDIPIVSLPDEGDYTVVITNSAGSITSAVAHLSLLERIPSLRNTGIDGSGATLPAGAIDPFWTLPINPDGGSADVYVGNDGWPIQEGVWIPNSAISKWVGSRAAVGGAVPAGSYLYRTTFDLTGRDTNTVIIGGRWATDNSGTVVTVNGTPVTVPLANGFGSWTPFTITSTQATFVVGINTLEFGVTNAGADPSGLRVEFTGSSARTLPGVPAAIGTQPQGGTYVEGDTATLTVTATGTLPISYQWMKNGVTLTGKTDATLVLANITSSDSGSYKVAVNNQWGNAVSSEAIVNVAYRAIPGVYGTGVGANGQLLAGGEVDPHFILGFSSDGSYPGPNAIVVNDGFPIGTWLNNGPKSKWIAPSATQGVGNEPGAYTYQTSINLTGQDLSKVQIVGAWGSDDTGTDILVNGVGTGITSPGFNALTPFVITDNLVAGVNTLDFMVNNGGAAANPTGVRVDLRVLIAIDQAPTMQITRSGNNVTISWSPDSAGVKLQSATSLGQWTDVQNQTNPYTTTTTGTMQFFRLTK